MFSLCLSLTLKHLRKQKLFLLIVIASITFGVAERVGVGTMLSSIQKALVEQSKNFLTADLSIKSTKPLRQSYQKDLEEALPGHAQKQLLVECLSIAVSSQNQKSALVEVKGIEKNFPFYGEFKIKNFQKTFDSKGQLESLNTYPVAILDKSLEFKLGVREGDIIRLGKTEFKVGGWIVSEPGQGAQSIALGPRIYVGVDFLLKSGLLDEGARVTYQQLYKLDSDTSSISLSKLLKSKWKLDDQDPRWSNPFGNKDGITVISHYDKAKQLLRLFGAVGHYFTLLTLVMLILTSVAVAGVVRGYVRQLVSQLGILQTLGMTPKYIGLFLLLTVLIISIIGTIFGGLIGIILYGIAHYWVGESLPVVSGYAFLWKPVLLGMMEGIVMALFFTSIPIILLYNAKPLDLLLERSVPFSYKSFITAVSLGFVSIGGIFSWELNSLTLGFGLVFGISLLGLFLYALFYAIVWILPRIRKGQSFAWEFGVHNLYRFRKYTIISMISLTFGALSLGLVSSYQSSLLSELQMDQDQPWPDLFMIGIPDNQYMELSNFFKQWPSKLQLEPMIKARYTHHNGKPIEKSTDDRIRQLQEREQNISFRYRLSESEKILKGEWNKGYYLVEASLENWFAKQLNIKLGDEITFDIQGVTVVAKVTSFRTVKWNSFQPNFFILLSPDAVKDAPKEWIGSISGLLKDDRYKIQSQVSDQFPNITVIDVAQTVEKARDVLNKLVTAIKVLALGAIFSGIMVILGVILFTISVRQSDTALLKTLGFRYPMILKATASEFLWLSGIASVTGAILASLLGWIIIENGVGIPFHLPFGDFFKLIAGIIILALLLSLWLARRLYKVKASIV